MAYNPNPAFNPMQYGGYPQQFVPQWNMPPYQQQTYQPMQQQNAQPTQIQNVQTQNNGGINWVQGEEGAKAYMVAAGNSVFLLDSEAPVFYIKSSDQSGIPLPLRIFDYTERTSAGTPKSNGNHELDNYVTRAEFNDLAARLDALTVSKEPRTRKTAVKEKTDENEQPTV